MGMQQEESVEQIKERLEATQARMQELERAIAGERAAAQTAMRDGLIRSAVRGCTDPEVAALVLRGAIKEGAGEREIAAAATRLRIEKPYLFSGALSGATAIPEGGQRGESGESAEAPALRAAAEKARGSGNRRDLAEYLYLRQSARGE